MKGFVTWPPSLYQNYYKGGQVTKPIMKNIYFKLLYVIQGVMKSFLIKVANYSYLVKFRIKKQHSEVSSAIGAEARKRITVDFSKAGICDALVGHGDVAY